MKLFQPYTMDNYGRDVILTALRRYETYLAEWTFDLDSERGKRQAVTDLQECRQVIREIENLPVTKTKQ